MSERLEDIARALVAPGKGILAADESSGTIKKRFDTIKLTSTEDSRRDYREMLFRSTEGMKNHVSGVILYDETIRQKAKDGTPLVDIMKAPGRSRASRSTSAPNRSPDRPSRSRRSPKASTDCASASQNTINSVRASRSGAASSRSPTAARRGTASRPMPTRSPATQHSPKRRRSYRSSSPKC